MALLGEELRATAGRFQGLGGGAPLRLKVTAPQCAVGGSSSRMVRMSTSAAKFSSSDVALCQPGGQGPLECASSGCDGLTQPDCLGGAGRAGRAALRAGRRGGDRGAPGILLPLRRHGDPMVQSLTCRICASFYAAM